MARLNLLCAQDLPGDDGLDIDVYLRRLDLWAAWIAQQTEANLHHFHNDPGKYEHSEPLWRVITMTTVLETHFGIRYEPRLKVAENWKWEDGRDVLLHGPLGPRRTGTCPSLPVLLVAIGRRLDYPMQLVHAPAHRFSRWEGGEHPRPDFRERFNIEYHGEGMATHPDDYYRHWPVEWTPEIIEAERRRHEPLYLRSLHPTEELAGFLGDRGAVLQENRRYEESHIANSAAYRLVPHNPTPGLHAQEAHKAKLQQDLARWGLTEQLFFDRLRLRQLKQPTPPFPWEHHGVNPLVHPAAPHGSMIANPIAAAIQSFSISSAHGRPAPGQTLSSHVPEASLQHAHWKAPS